MHTIPFMAWLSANADTTILLAANILAQTTLVAAAGFLAAHLVRNRGAAAQSVTLRAALLAALVCPAAYPLLRSAGLPEIRFEVPFIPERTPEDIPAVGHTAPRPSAAGSSAPRPDAAPPRRVRESGLPSAVTLADSPPASSAEALRTAPDRSGKPVGLHPDERADSRVPKPRGMFTIAFALLWLVLSSFLLARIGVHLLYILHLRRSAYEAKATFVEVCRNAARTIGVDVPAVLQHPSVRSPFLAGLVRPCILLPLGSGELECSSRAVFLHELAHLHRHDTFWNLLGRLAIALLPFQPLLWALARRIEETSDFVCDDYAVRYGGARIYATELVNVAHSFRPMPDSLSAGAGFISVSSSLYRRVERVLDTSRTLTLRVGSRIMVFVYPFCLCVIFLSGLIGFRGKSFARAERAVETLRRDGVFAALGTVAAVREQIRAATRVPAPEQSRAESSASGPDLPPEAASNPFPAGNSAGDAAPRPDETAPAQAGNPVPALTVEFAPTVSHAPGIPGPSPASTESAARTVGSLSGKASAPDAGHAPEADNPVQSEPGAILAAILTSEAPAAAKPGPLEIDIPETLGAGALREGLEQGQENPVWSPSGKLIAFTGNGGRGIWAVPVNGGKPALVYDNTASGTSSVRTLSFSSDGSELVFVNSAPGAAKASAAGAHTPMPVIEGLNLLTGKRRVIAEGAFDGCWSGDGRYMVYVESDSSGIIALDTVTGMRRVISETGCSPCMVPGDAVIYVDQSRAGQYQLFRAPVSGGVPEQLTEDGNWWEPECSPEGEWVLCTGPGSTRYGSAALIRAFNLRDRMSYYIMVEGSESVGMGDWSPSGNQFCYTRTRGTGAGGTTIHISNFQPESFSRSGTETAHPAEFKLVGNYPNPFNPSTTIRFTLPSTGSAELVIYSMTGQKIRELVSGPLEAGDHSIVWNGRDQEGRPVSSGIYVARLKMEGKVAARRMTLVK